MSSPSAVVCREVFDENSQPSAEEICEYAQQLGIDPESESHLLPLARDGLMQALPPPWKAYYDEKLQTHYYYNEETKNTQWEHPLDNVYRDLVKKARDASMLDDTCASVQELLTSEENTKNLERVETKAESDEEFSTDSENHPAETKDNTLTHSRRLTPIGRPPPSPLTRFDKKLSDLRISPLRRSVDGAFSKPLVRNTSDKDLLNRPSFERPKMLFKQQSEIIDLKINVTSPDEENFKSLFTPTKSDKGFALMGKGNMFLKLSKSDLPSPDTDKSLPLDSVTKSDPPKGILREKLSDLLHKKSDNLLMGKQRQASSLEEDKKSVRFKLENLPDPTISPGSNSSSEQNDGQSSIISAPVPTVPSPVTVPSLTQSPVTHVEHSPVTHAVQSPVTHGVVLSPLVNRPPLPPRLSDSPRDVKSLSVSDRDSVESEARDRGTSPRRRILRPPAGDYIKPDLFQKNFQKISDLVRPGDIDTSPVHLEEPVSSDKESRPRSPMIPQKSKISINLMESIESETSIDSPDREFANLDLNDLDDSNDSKEKQTDDDVQENDAKDIDKDIDSDRTSRTSNVDKPPKVTENVQIPQIKVPNIDFQSKNQLSESEDSKKNSNNDISKNSKSSIEIKSSQLKTSPTPSLGSEFRSPRLDYGKAWSPLSTFKPLNKAVIAPQIKSSDSASSLGKGLASPRLDGVMLSQGKSSSDNVVVVYQFETQEESLPKPIKSPMIPDMGTRDFIERHKSDERRRLELSLQKELENIRAEWMSRERKMRAELQEELREAEEKFLTEKKLRLKEQSERHQREMEEGLSACERNHQQALHNAKAELEERYRREREMSEKHHADDMGREQEQYRTRLYEQRERLEIENERALQELREQLQASLNKERARIVDENRTTVDALREEHNATVTELRHDYRAEVCRVRAQHLCHLAELRARLSAARALPDRYRRLKEKYATLKRDVQMSMERRNKRREMSMTTGSETEKSNSHKGNQHERRKEILETSTSAVAEETSRPRVNNNPTPVYNDNESYSESNAHKPDNNNQQWTRARDHRIPSADTSQTSGSKIQRAHRKTAVAFQEPPRRRRDGDGHLGATTDCQDSSDATTADEKIKESINGHGRRRCFTRLKSASTSRLNYSPK